MYQNDNVIETHSYRNLIYCTYETSQQLFELYDFFLYKSIFLHKQFRKLVWKWFKSLTFIAIEMIVDRPLLNAYLMMLVAV